MTFEAELKRLNTEFAVRVLGNIVKSGVMIHGDGWCEIPRYTESLDLAWPGVEGLEPSFIEIELTSRGWEVVLWFAPDSPHDDSKECAPTIKEALVRACLEAVK